MHFTCRSFIGSPSSSGWSQFWEIEPAGSSLGHLFGLIDLQPVEAHPELPQLGREIIAYINNLFFQPSAVSVTTQLKLVINQITAKYPLPASGLSLFLVVSTGSAITVAQSNRGVILLKRQSQFSHLTQAEGQIVSGTAAPLDTFLLATPPFIDQIGLDKIKNFLLDSKIQNIEENLVSSLFSLPDQSGSSAVLIRINPDDDDQLSVTPPISAPPPSPVSSPPSPVASVAPPVRPSLFSRLFTKRPVYVSSQETNESVKRKKINLIIALLLLITLLVSSYFGYQKNKQIQAETNYQQLKSEIEKNISGAQAAKNLDLDTALETARQGQTVLEKIEKLKLHPTEVSQYQTQIQQLLSQTGSTNALKPELFYDLTLIDNQVQYSQILVNSSELILLDTTRGRLDSLNLSQRNKDNLALNDGLKQAITFTVIKDKYYFADSQAIYLISPKENKPLIQFSTKNQDIKPLSLQSWNQALYLLDGGTPTIWKFTPNSSGFDQGQIWLKESSFPADPTSMAINGSVWVLFGNGELKPYLLGRSENYHSLIAGKLLNSNHLVTGVDSDILAFTSSGNLIYFLQKDGQIKAKYDYGDIEITSLAYHESDSTLYLLSRDQKIYQLKY